MSFMVNHLIGFGVGKFQVLLGNATGTNIGNSSVGFSAGGLAAAFDGVTNQALVSCCRSNGGNPAWFGKYFSSQAKLWSGFRVYSPNNALISGNTSGHTGTWEFYVKQFGQATSETDGTLVATGTWVEPTSFTSQYEVSNLLINPTAGESAFVRLRFIGNSGNDVNVAEVQLFHDS